MLVGLIASAALAVAQPAGLAYRLTPGAELEYRCETVRTTESGRAATPEVRSLRLWCIGTTEDGWVVLLVVRPVDGAAAGGAGDAAVVYLDASGAPRVPPETMAQLPDFAEALLSLPPTPKSYQGNQRWDTTGPFERTWRCERDTTVVDAAVRVRFTVQGPGCSDAVLGWQTEGTYTFDTDAGQPREVEWQRVDTRRGTRVRTHTTFVARRQQTAAWAVRRSLEAAKYRLTLRHDQRLRTQLSDDPAQCEQTIRLIDQLWAGFRSEVDQRVDTPFFQLADDRRQLLAAEAPLLVARAALAQTWLGHAAGTWTLPQPDGTLLTSEQARQGVVIECFWSSADPLSLHSLSAFRALQQDATLRRLHVPVLSYNLDVGVPWATQADAACEPSLGNLAAGPLQMVTPLTDLPIVRVLDGEQIVRAVRIGWQPDYTDIWQVAAELARTRR